MPLDCALAWALFDVALLSATFLRRGGFENSDKNALGSQSEWLYNEIWATTYLGHEVDDMWEAANTGCRAAEGWHLKRKALNKCLIVASIIKT